MRLTAAAGDGATQAGPDRAQQALHEGEEWPDPRAQKGHQSAAYYPTDQNDVRNAAGFQGPVHFGS